LFIDRSGEFVLPEVLYVRGWDDCLEALEMLISKAKDLQEVKAKVECLRKLVKEDKFEKIRFELGAYNIF
jgi:hypothetical protein